MQDKISIIIPVYNSEKYIDKTIESVLNQTYKNIEIVCVNDGSTDSSLNKLNEIQKKDDRFVIINQDNQGGSVARNVGLKYATGDYIAFLDNDDIYHPQYLEILLHIMKKNNCDLSICNNTYFSDDHNFSFNTKYDINNLTINKISNHPFFDKFVMKNKFPMLMWDKLAKRDVYKDIQFDVKLPAINDIVLNMEVLYNSKRCIYINEQLYAWRHRFTSQTNQIVSEKKLEEFFELIKSMNNFVKTKKLCFLENMFINRYISKQVYFLFIRDREKDGSLKQFKDIIREKILYFRQNKLFQYKYLWPSMILKIKRELSI